MEEHGGVLRQPRPAGMDRSGPPVSIVPSSASIDRSRSLAMGRHDGLGQWRQRRHGRQLHRDGRPGSCERVLPDMPARTRTRRSPSPSALRASTTQ
jgi:hypothetical protein